MSCQQTCLAMLNIFCENSCSRHIFTNKFHCRRNDVANSYCLAVATICSRTEHVYLSSSMPGILMWFQSNICQIFTCLRAKVSECLLLHKNLFFMFSASLRYNFCIFCKSFSYFRFLASCWQKQTNSSRAHCFQFFKCQQ